MFDLTAGRCEMTLDGTCSILVCYPASSSEEFRLTLNSQLQRECVCVCVWTAEGVIHYKKGRLQTNDGRVFVVLSSPSLSLSLFPSGIYFHTPLSIVHARAHTYTHLQPSLHFPRSLFLLTVFSFLFLFLTSYHPHPFPPPRLSSPSLSLGSCCSSSSRNNRSKGVRLLFA